MGMRFCCFPPNVEMTVKRSSICAISSFFHSPFWLAKFMESKNSYTHLSCRLTLPGRQHAALHNQYKIGHNIPANNYRSLKSVEPIHCRSGQSPENIRLACRFYALAWENLISALRSSNSHMPWKKSLPNGGLSLRSCIHAYDIYSLF